MATETKNERFRRLAAARGERLLKELSLLGNLSNRNNYDYSDEEIGKLFSVLEAELKECKAKFMRKKLQRRIEF